MTLFIFLQTTYFKQNYFLLFICITETFLKNTKLIIKYTIENKNTPLNNKSGAYKYHLGKVLKTKTDNKFT